MILWKRLVLFNQCQLHWLKEERIEIKNSPDRMKKVLTESEMMWMGQNGYRLDQAK